MTKAIADEAVRQTTAAWSGETSRTDAQRDGLALGSLMSGYVIDAAWYGLHHVLAQTLVRETGIGHGPANAVMLPHSIGALERRQPGAVDPDGEIRTLAERLAQIAEAPSLRALGVDRRLLGRCAELAAQRVELDNTPPRAERQELHQLYERAW